MRERFTSLHKAIERTRDASSIHGLAHDLQPVLWDLNKIARDHGIEEGVLYTNSGGGRDNDQSAITPALTFHFIDPYALSKGEKFASGYRQLCVTMTSPIPGKPIRETLVFVPLSELKEVVLKTLNQWLRLAGDIFPGDQKTITDDTHLRGSNEPKAGYVEPVATSSFWRVDPMTAPWIKGLVDFRDRFAKAAAKHEELTAMLVHRYFDDGDQLAPPIDLKRPFHEGLRRSKRRIEWSAMESAVNDHRISIRDRTAYLRGFSRKVYFSADGMAERDYTSIAKEAGSLLFNGLPEVVESQIWREWQVESVPKVRLADIIPSPYPGDEHLANVAIRTNAVFELSWQHHSRTPLSSERYIDIVGGKCVGSWVGIPLHQFEQEKRNLVNKYEVKHDFAPQFPEQPPGWYSSIDNMLTASVQACDILLSLAREVNDSASDQSQEVVDVKETRDTASLTFALHGSGFLVKGFGESGHVPTLKGFRQIYMLLKEPSHRVDMRSLAACETVEAADAWSKQETLDSQAKRELGEKLAELVNEKRNAEEENNATEAKHCQEAMDRISAELNAASGLRGRDRDLNSDIEKLRPRIRGTLVTAYQKLQDSGMSTLASHFRRHISASGSDFIYSDGPVWNLDISDSQ